MDGSPPALGLRIYGILLRNEWFKTRKRIAYWLALGFFAFVSFMNSAEPFFERDPEFVLPGAWGGVFGDDGGIMLLIFGGMTLLLLSTTEFTWRTARQNVIDGLSKSQWFWGKSMLLGIVGLSFLAAYVLIPAVLALIRTDVARTAEAIVPLSAVQAAGATMLAFLSVGGLAFFISLAARNTGGAMGLWFLWFFTEQGILPPLVGRFLPDLAAGLQYLPFSNATQMFGFRNYDAGAYERFLAAAQEAERTVPAAPDVAPHLVAAGGWVIALLGVSYFWFRRRDL